MNAVMPGNWGNGVERPCAAAMRWIVLTLCLASALQGPTAKADAIVISRAMKATTIAEVFIEDAAVRVELEIGVRDFDGFQNLLPDELLRKMGRTPAPLAERLPKFFLEDLTVRFDDGPPLPGFVKSMEGRRRVERDEITGEPLPAAEDEGEAVVSATLIYPFRGRPKTIAIKPPVSEEGYSAASIGFVAYHLGLPVNDFRYLTREEAADLDWGDPWYSQFRNKNLWRQYNEPINAFLYIEPYEVRVEVIARPKDLQQWVDLGVEGRDTLPVDSQAALKQEVLEFVGKNIHLTIDGRSVPPQFSRINFLRRTLRTSTVIDPPEELDLDSATLGVIFVQPTAGLPQEAALTWDLFSPKFPVVRAAATDEAGPMPYRLRPDDNVLEWRNFLKNPTIPKLVDLEPPDALTRLPVPIPSILCVILLVPIAVCVIRGQRSPITLVPIAVLVLGSVLAWPYARVSVANPLAKLTAIRNEDAAKVVGALLKNVYVAFDFRDESTIYDALARSASGELLTNIYLETQKSLELRSQGGARVKVKEVELLEVDQENLKGEVGFVATCTWNVRGSVGHWGHIHQRTNQYKARITVKPVDGEWKIVDLEVLQEERIS